MLDLQGIANIAGLLLANLVEACMRRKRRILQHSKTQGYSLRDHIELHHPLVELPDTIDWQPLIALPPDHFNPGRVGRFCYRVSS